MLQGKEDYCDSYTLGVFAEDRPEMLRSCDDNNLTLWPILGKFCLGDIISE